MWSSCLDNSGFPAFVAQRIEHLTTDQKVGGSSPSKRTNVMSKDIIPKNPQIMNSGGLLSSTRLLDQEVELRVSIG